MDMIRLVVNFFHKKQLYALNNCGDDSQNNTFWGHSRVYTACSVIVDTLLENNVLHQTKPHGNSRLKDVTLKHVTLNTAFARTCTLTTFRLIGGLCLNRVHCPSCYLSWFACIANKRLCDRLLVGFTGVLRAMQAYLFAAGLPHVLTMVYLSCRLLCHCLCVLFATVNLLTNDYWPRA